MHLPEFIDNQNGNTLALALAAFLGVRSEDGEAEPCGPSDTVRIATAFSNPTGFAKPANAK